MSDCIFNMIDLSTGYIPPDVATAFDVGAHRWQAHEHGWIVWFSSDAHAMGNEPDWFKAIADLAKRRDCLIINFDSDGTHDPDLPKYDW